VRYTTLGRSGLRVSRLALGTWRTWGTSLDYDAAERVFRRALEGGVNLVDLADVYAGGQAEAWLGWMMQSLRRDDLVICTKACWPTGAGVNAGGLSARHLAEAVEGSLRRLRTDRVDLFLCHRSDPGTPTPESVRAIGRLVAAGKVVHWGVSTGSAADLVDLARTADALGVPRPVACQPPYSLLDRAIERELLPTARRLGVGSVVFSPLAQGVLTGKYLAAAPPDARGADPARASGMERYLDRREAVAGLAALAGELETTPGRVALAWVLRRRGGVASALFGASTPEQVEDNLGGLELSLDGETLDRLDGLFPAPAPLPL